MTDAPDSNPPAPPSASNPLANLPSAQVFARDPEDYTTENLADTIARLAKNVARYRKARDDEAAIKEHAAKLKKTNEAASKKKAKSKIATDPMETTL